MPYEREVAREFLGHHHHFHPPHQLHIPQHNNQDLSLFSGNGGGGNGGDSGGGLVGAIGVSMAANPALWIVGGIIIGGIIIYALTREEEA